MTQTTTQVFPLNEIWSSFSQIGGTFADGMSELPSKLSQAITNGVIDYNKVATAFGENYRYYAQKTLEFSERAANAGRATETQVFRDWSAHFARQANSFLDQSLSAKVRIDQWVGGMNNTIQSMGQTGKYIGPVFDAAQMIVAIASGDVQAVGAASTGILASEFAGAVGFAGAVFLAVTTVGTAPIWFSVGTAALFAGAANYYGNDIYDFIRPGLDTVGGWIPDWVFKMADSLIGSISNSVNDSFTTSRGWTVPRDPLVLDLDGDGIETVGISPGAPILFDHDADGTRTGTGWIKSDDGLLVLDVNGNGVIDSGRELFGDNTRLGNPANNVNATNGYQALAQHDSNGDGRINSTDAIYSQLRVWRDLNQDGISQTNELQTLAQTGIASIGVAGTASNTNLGNGNTQLFSGTFTRTNGTAGQSGVVCDSRTATSFDWTESIYTRAICKFKRIKRGKIYCNARYIFI